jgi:hypothetical protein
MAFALFPLTRWKPFHANKSPPLSTRYRFASHLRWESIRASLEPYAEWIEQMLDVPLSETLTLDVDCNPADAVAEELLRGLP